MLNFNFSFSISQESFDLLKLINENGFVDSNQPQTFIKELLNLGFISKRSDYNQELETWSHLFVLSNFGENFLNQTIVQKSEEMTADEIISLHRKAKNIFESNKSWEEKYDLIFSENFSKKLNLDYYDPDTNEEEDLTAWMRAFDDYVEEIKILVNQKRCD